MANGSLDQRIVAAAQLGVDDGSGASGEELNFAQVVIAHRVSRTKQRGQTLIADFVTAKAVHARHAWQGSNLVGECGFDCGMAISGRILLAGCTNKSALSWLFIHNCTVWRKLPTMIPTDVVIAIAVANAPTSTDVRRSDAARLRDASIASTPPMRRSMPEEIIDSPLTNAGMGGKQTRR